MSPKEHKHYKELQRQAKLYNIPANMKRPFLESAIEAYLEKNYEKLHSILEYNRNLRQRRLCNQPKNLTKPKNKRKKSIIENVLQSPCAEHFPQEYQERILCPDSSGNSRTQVVNCTPNTQYFTPDPIFNQSHENPLIDMRSTYASSYFKSVPALFSRNSIQEPYNKAESLSLFYKPGVYRAPIIQQGQYYDNVNFNYAHESYYSQIPVNAHNTESNNWTPYSEVTYERQLMYPLKSDFLSKPNQLPTNEPDCALPNIPQLRGSPANSPTLSLKSSSDRCSISCESKTKNPYEIANGLKNVDSGSNNAEFDSNSDTETLSLPEEIVQLFDSDPENRNNSQSNISLASPNTGACSQLETFTNTECGSSSSSYPLYDGSSSQNHVNEELSENAPQYLSYLSSQINEMSMNDRSHLPPISTLLPISYSAANKHDNSNSQDHVKMSKADFNGSSISSRPSNLCTEYNGKKTGPETFKAAEDISQYKIYKNDNDSLHNHTIPYLSSNSSQTSASILKSYLSSQGVFPINDLSTPEESLSSSAIETGILNLLPTEVLNEALEEMQFGLKPDCIKNANLNGKHFKPERENLSKTEATRVIYKHELISIEDVKADNIQKDLFCKSFRIVIPDMKKRGIEMTLRTAAEKKVSLLQSHGNESQIAMYRPCKYQERGCMVILKHNEANTKLHEKECGYQLVYCPMEKCSWNQSVRMFHTHVCENHKMEMNLGNDSVYVINRIDSNPTFVTYVQVFNGTIFIIRMHINDTNFVATIQYIPEFDSTTCLKKRVKGIMQLIYFTSRVESKCWKGFIQPYFENDETRDRKGEMLQSTIGTSKNIVIRVLLTG